MRCLYCASFLLVAAVIAWAILQAPSRQTIVPTPDEIVTACGGAWSADVGFEPALPNLESIILQLPPRIKRRPVALSILSGAGEPILLECEDPDSTKDRRYSLPEPLTAREDLVLRIASPDGPILGMEGGDEGSWDGFMIARCYRHDWKDTLRRFSLFKPVRHPVAVTAALLIAYGAAVILLLCRGRTFE